MSSDEYTRFTCCRCDKDKCELKPERYDGSYYCEDCMDEYDNKTGYCSFSCCMGEGCDGSC